MGGVAAGWRSLTQARIASAKAASVALARPQRFEGAERDLGFLALLADEADGDLFHVGAGVAEQALVDVADLLDVDVAERDPTGGLAPEPGDLDGAERLDHDPVADGDRQRACAGRGR